MVVWSKNRRYTANPKIKQDEVESPAYKVLMWHVDSGGRIRGHLCVDCDVVVPAGFGGTSE